MMQRYLFFSKILVFLSIPLIILSCASQKTLLEGEQSGVLQGETVMEEPYGEEPGGLPGVIEEEELQALRILEKEALREGSLEDVYFDFNRYNLKNDSQVKLQKTAEWLIKNPTVAIAIEGHCDERGTQEYNLALGERRATSVQKYLYSLGIEPLRMQTISYGEERPLDPRHNEEAWDKNRRAHFNITKK